MAADKSPNPLILKWDKTIISTQFLTPQGLKLGL